MITKEQAMTLEVVHIEGCRHWVSSRGLDRYQCQVARRNGQTQIWVTRPEDFRVPIKYGLKEFGQITPVNATWFHVPSECPIEALREQVWSRKDL